MQRKQCQALIETTHERCKNSALRFSKYCWSHESKASHFISLFLGAIIVFLLTQASHWLFTTTESRKLLAPQKNTDTKPSFRILVNGIAIGDLSQVPIPYTDNALIKIRIQNMGSAPASEVSACIIYPAYFTQVSADGWSEQLSSDWHEHEQIMSETEVAHHRVLSKAPLAVGDGLSLPDIQIKNPKNCLIPFALRVWAPNSEVSITRFILTFANK